jgi:hypothetical protein
MSNEIAKEVLRNAIIKALQEMSSTELISILNDELNKINMKMLRGK